MKISQKCHSDDINDVIWSLEKLLSILNNGWKFESILSSLMLFQLAESSRM